MGQLAGDAGGSAPLFPDKKAGVWGQSDSGYGVAGTAESGNGLQGGSIRGFGAVGTSDNSIGVIGISQNAAGVHGISHLAGKVDLDTLPFRIPSGGTGVYGVAAGPAGVGVRGEATDPGVGVVGLGKVGLHGEGSIAAVVAIGIGSATGVLADVKDGDGVVGSTQTGEEAFHGYHGNGAEARICCHLTANGDRARGNYVDGKFLIPEPGMAGQFFGDVVVIGQLFKQGGGFRIDHPLHPAEQYLVHSFVESSERKNVYDGTAVLDASGRSIVDMPSWFEALNDRFRYQLTAIGSGAPELHVERELSRGQFVIAGGTPNLKVCWQVTGLRRDPWAMANDLKVEQNKCDAERGHFLNPALYQRPPEFGIQKLKPIELGEQDGSRPIAANTGGSELPPRKPE